MLIKFFSFGVSMESETVTAQFSFARGIVIAKLKRYVTYRLFEIFELGHVTLQKIIN